MSSPVTVQLSGAVSVVPIGCAPGLSLYDTLRLSLTATYAEQASGSPTVNSPTTPVAVGLGSIAKVRFLAMKFQGQSFRVLVTSPNGGVDQVLPTSDLIIIHAPNVGDEITALKVVGVGQFSYIAAGNPS